jgi:O-acetyl-ADP-ribose deacetylase (regulator of RNase III)
MPLRLFLVDANPDVAVALRSAFQTFPEVTVSHANLLSVAHNAVVSPANSSGFMDGGIDAAFCRFFGVGLERRVRDAIDLRPEGRLPVGASLIVETRNANVPYLIVAPTMLFPEAIDSMNCYRAMRAVLRVSGRDERIWPGLFCPGLGTGVGRVAPEDAAREMAKAYGDWKDAA